MYWSQTESSKCSLESLLHYLAHPRIISVNERRSGEQFWTSSVRATLVVLVVNTRVSSSSRAALRYDLSTAPSNLPAADNRVVLRSGRLIFQHFIFVFLAARPPLCNEKGFHP